MDQETKIPSRKLLDITFWITQIVLAVSVYLFLKPESWASMPNQWLQDNCFILALMVLLLVSIFHSVIFGIFANRHGKNGWVWGAIHAVLAPYSFWLMYVLSFFFKPNSNAKI